MYLFSPFVILIKRQRKLLKKTKWFYWNKWVEKPCRLSQKKKIKIAIALLKIQILAFSNKTHYFWCLCVILFMLRKLFYLLLLISFSGLRAQEFSTHYKTKKIVASKNGIQLDSVSLNSSFFKLENNKGKQIDSSFYKIDFQKMR